MCSERTTCSLLIEFREEEINFEESLNKKLLGIAVTVGVSMFVLSISELSEVGMVRMKNRLINYVQFLQVENST